MSMWLPSLEVKPFQYIHLALSQKWPCLDKNLSIAFVKWFPYLVPLSTNKSNGPLALAPLFLNQNQFIFILLMVLDSYCSMWGCKGHVFASQNGSWWCPFNFRFSPLRSPLVQSVKITFCLGESIACDFWLQWGFGGEMSCKVCMKMLINTSFTLKLELKDFLTSCLTQFKVYIWSATWCYDIDKYLNETKEQTYIILDPSRVLGQKLSQKNNHFFTTNLEKHVFHNNLDAFFLKFLNTMLGTFCL